MNDTAIYHLVKTIVDMAAFLEFSGADIVDEDAAVEAMEQMAAELQLITDGREMLIEQFHRISQKYEEPYQTFVREFPESFGIQ